MKRAELEKTNLSPNFIGSWIIEPSLCDEIIFYFEKNQQKQTQGKTGKGLNLEVKNRQDISLAPQELKLPENEIFKNYFESLWRLQNDTFRRSLRLFYSLVIFIKRFLFGELKNLR